MGRGPVAAILLAGLAAPALPSAPARAEGGMSGVMACFAALSPDEFAGRFEDYANARGFDARMRQLCSVGDQPGAEALAAEVEAGFLAADPAAAAVRRCLADLTATADGTAKGDVCDAGGGWAE